MHSTILRSRTHTLAALALLLVVPSTALAVDEGDWGFRQAFRSYVYSGTGIPPITATAGATCDPNPDTVRGGCDPKLSATTDVFGWTATDASYTLPNGAGTIDLQGNVTFSRPDHFFTMSIIDPIVTVDTEGDAIVNVHVTLVSDFPSVPDHDGRLNFGEFHLTSVVETATTVTWQLDNGQVTSEAATALGNFLTAGSALDPIRIILPLDDPTPTATATVTPILTATPTPTSTPTPTPGPGTPISSTKIQLKDDPEKPAKRGLSLGVSKEPLVVPADVNPTVDGVTVRVVSSASDDTYVLPASNWKASFKKGVIKDYKYSDSKRLLGPISSAKISAGGLKLTGKGEALGHALATEPQDLSIVVSSGDVSFCAGPGGAISKKTFTIGKTFKSTKNSAPASCPAATN